MNSPEYNAWVNMKQRCHNPNHPEYHRYGARGISVCSRWMLSFKAFLDDMGEKPSAFLSLEKVDNDVGYSKENCKWATKSEQSYNRRVGTDNKSGLAGVYLEKQTHSWKAFIRVKGKQLTLGRFKDFFDACCARKSAEILYYGELND